MDSEDRLLNLRYWKDLASRQRWVILGCTIGVIALTTLFSLFQRPVYESTCTLYLKQKRVQPLSFDDIYTKDPGRPTDRLLALMEIVRSAPVVERAVRDLEEKGVLSFKADGDSPQSGWFQSLLDRVQGGSPKTPQTPESKRAAYAAALRDKTTVIVTGGNSFLAISVRQGDPDLASAFANAVANAYLKSDRDLMRRSAEGAVTWLSSRVREQRAKLLDAEEKLGKFSRKSVPKAEAVGDLAVQEMNRLQGALLDVRIKLLEAEAQKKMGVGGVPTGAGVYASAADLQAEVTNALRERVRKELVDTSVNLTQLRQRYGERHPDVIQAAEKEKQLTEQLERLSGPPAASAAAAGTKGSPTADPAIEAMRAQERALSSSLQKSMQSSVASGQAGLQFEILRREVEINRSLYNEMLSRLNEITISAGLDSDAAEVFEPGSAPSSPIFPNYPMNIGLGLLGGLLLGLASGAVRDHLDQSVRDPAQANDLLKAPVLGVIPHHGRDVVPARDQGRGLWVMGASESPQAEAYRILRSHIEGQLASQDDRVLLVTSAVPGEGKTTTAVNLAAAFAEAGRSVLLVDGDLRRPSVSSYFRLEPEACLSRVLTGSRLPEDAVRATWVQNLKVLGCQPRASLPDEANLTESFRKLFDWARDRFDRVVVDTPVAMVVPGVAEMARAGGGVLLVHRPGWVPAHALGQVREHLVLSKTPLVGVVLNGVRAHWVGNYPLLPHYSTAYRSRPTLLKGDRDATRSMAH